MLLPRRTLLLTLPALPVAARAAAESQRLVIPVATEPPGLIPGISDDPVTRLVGTKVYAGLLRIGPGGAVLPDLAATYDTAEDGRRFTFRLRPGVTWHDGAPCTAADAVFSIARFHRSLSARTGPLLAGLREARALDPLTATFQFAEPFDAFPWLADALSLPIVPQHVHDRDDGPPDPMLWRPVGTGPYRLLAWGRLTRFDGYAGPVPPIGELAFPLLPDPATRLAVLGAGGALLAGTALDPAVLPRLRQDAGLAVAGEAPPNLAWLASLLVNTAASPLDQVAVRRALSQAIDRAAVLRDGWGGLGRIATGPLASISRFAPEADLLPPYDPRAASQALTAADLRPDDEGVRATLRLIHPEDAAWRRAAARLAGNVRQVGLHLAAEPLPPDALAARVASGDFHLAAAVAEQAADPALMPGSPFPGSGGGDERRAAVAAVAMSLAEAMPQIWLAELAIPVARDRRVRVPGGIYASFADAAFTP